ncbi:hypothetical protein [Lonepinella sp. BR2919]|uniref:hypothetical protein n=1 Tax=unclassified Lonepinella TaxID=2642006 RepID=UPI003F6DCF55
MQNIKQQFLTELSKGSIVAHQSTDLLNQIPENEFVEFNSAYPIVECATNEARLTKWSADYFYKQIPYLERMNFSKKRAEHLIAVKAYLQELDVKGFAVKTSATLDENIDEVEDNSQLDDIESILQQQQDLLQNYQPDSRLEMAVAEKDKEHIHVILMSDLNNNRLDIREILQAMYYVLSHFPEAFEKYSLSKFYQAIEIDQTKWNEDYFYLQQSYLNHNFSLERLFHLIMVKKYIGFDQIIVSREDDKTEKSSSDEDFLQSIKKWYEENKTLVNVGGLILAGLLVLFSILK